MPRQMYFTSVRSFRFDTQFVLFTYYYSTKGSPALFANKIYPKMKNLYCSPIITKYVIALVANKICN